jgi:hypothetical protein
MFQYTILIVFSPAIQLDNSQGGSSSHSEVMRQNLANMFNVVSKKIAGYYIH